MLARVIPVEVRDGGIDDLPAARSGSVEREIHQPRDIAQRRVDLSLDSRRLMAPGRQTAVDSHPDCGGNRSQQNRQAKMMRDYSNALRSIEERTESRRAVARKIGNSDRAHRSTLYQLRRSENRRITTRDDLHRARSIDDTHVGKPLQQQSEGGPARCVLAAIGYQHSATRARCPRPARDLFSSMLGMR